jgi:flagellar hook-length control protein FliK
MNIFDMLLGGSQPSQLQPAAGTSTPSADSAMPFDTLIQQLLDSDSHDQSGRGRLPFVVAPNPAFDHPTTRAGRTPDAIHTNPAKQPATLGLMVAALKGAPDVAVPRTATASPELLMRQLLRSGTAAEIDFGHSQIALERSATDGQLLAVDIESLIAQAGFATRSTEVPPGDQMNAQSAEVVAAALSATATTDAADVAAKPRPDAHSSTIVAAGTVDRMTDNTAGEDPAEAPRISVRVDVTAARHAAGDWAFPHTATPSNGGLAEPVPQTNNIAAVAAENTTPAEDTDLSVSPEVSDAAGDPRLHLAATASVRQVLISQPAELSPGTYHITDISVSGDRVQFTVIPSKQGAPNADSSATMKINLPLENVSRALQSVSAEPGPVRQQITRVQLDGITQPVRRIEAILNQLNVHKIEITHREVEAAGADQARSNAINARQVQLTISPDKAHHQPVRVEVNASQLHAVTEQRVNIETTPRVSLTSGNGNTSGNGQSLTDNASGQQQFGGLFDKRQDMAGTAFRFTSGKDASSVNRFEQMFGLEGQTQSGGNTSASDASRSRPVRVIIPETEMMKLRSNGQTIRLQLEPDTLGPARLTLTMQGNTLKAQVMVESYQAKAVVESSLQELTSQLGRANIKVDHITVEVASDGADQHWQFERRPQWHSRSHGSYASLASDDENNEIADNATILTGTSVNEPYGIRAGSVNLIA